MASRVGRFCAALVLCGARIAHAASSSSPPLALEIDNQLGWVQGQHSGGVDLGATVRLRYYVLTAGLSLQGATILFGSMGSASAVAGLSIPVEFVRLDALAELGVNAYADVGSNFMNQDPGTGATLPFVGFRTSLLARIAHNSRGLSVWVGPSVHYAKDLYSTTRTYTYRDQHQDWFDNNYTDELVTRTVHIGQSRVSLLATIGISLPL
jgi:hypothetical protein